MWWLFFLKSFSNFIKLQGLNDRLKSGRLTAEDKILLEVMDQREKNRRPVLTQETILGFRKNIESFLAHLSLWIRRLLWWLLTGGTPRIKTGYMYMGNEVLFVLVSYLVALIGPLVTNMIPYQMPIGQFLPILFLEIILALFLRYLTSGVAILLKKTWNSIPKAKLDEKPKNDLREEIEEDPQDLQEIFLKEKQQNRQ